MIIGKKAPGRAPSLLFSVVIGEKKYTERSEGFFFKGLEPWGRPMTKLNTYRTGPDEAGHFGIYGGRFVGKSQDQRPPRPVFDPGTCQQNAVFVGVLWLISLVKKSLAYGSVYFFTLY